MRHVHSLMLVLAMLVSSVAGEDAHPHTHEEETIELHHRRQD